MGNIKSVKKPGKKVILILAVLAIAAVAAVVFTTVMDRGQNVEFKVLSEKEIPQEISSDVIPEYRTLERALACVVDEKVYVVVTRGEKPASGYKVDIRKMKIEKEEGKETLIVYADFCDPSKGESISQVLTYPVKVAETGLKKLPDEIELRVQYEE